MKNRAITFYDGYISDIYNLDKVAKYIRTEDNVVIIDKPTEDRIPGSTQDKALDIDIMTISEYKKPDIKLSINKMFKFFGKFTYMTGVFINTDDKIAFTSALVEGFRENGLKPSYSDYFTLEDVANPCYDGTCLILSSQLLDAIHNRLEKTFGMDMSYPCVDLQFKRVNDIETFANRARTLRYDIVKVLDNKEIPLYLACNTVDKRAIAFSDRKLVFGDRYSKIAHPDINENDYFINLKRELGLFHDFVLKSLDIRDIDSTGVRNFSYFICNSTINKLMHNLNFESARVVDRIIEDSRIHEGWDQSMLLKNNKYLDFEHVFDNYTIRENEFDMSKYESVKDTSWITLRCDNSNAEVKLHDITFTKSIRMLLLSNSEFDRLTIDNVKSNEVINIVGLIAMSRCNIVSITNSNLKLSLSSYILNSLYMQKLILRNTVLDIVEAISCQSTPYFMDRTFISEIDLRGTKLVNHDDKSLDEELYNTFMQLASRARRNKGSSASGDKVTIYVDENTDGRLSDIFHRWAHTIGVNVDLVSDFKVDI